MPCRFSLLAVMIATIIVTISGIAASRLRSPMRSRAPQTNSAVEASTALNPGAGIPSSVKKSVTFGRLCSLPQPVPMKTTPSVRRAKVGPRKERRSAVERKAACAREMNPIRCFSVDVGWLSHGDPFCYSAKTRSVTACNAAPPAAYPRAFLEQEPEMTSTRPLQGQKAIVTGANSGIGRAIAIALGGAGADVVVNYRDGEDAAVEVVRAITQSGSRALAHRADVSREEEVKELFQRAIEHFGTVDILVNNAGLQRDAAFEDITLEQWNTVIGVNLTGQFLCAREAVREFKRRGVVESVSKAAGKIICISSVHEVIPWAGHVNYAASKGGVMLMMKSLAQEVAPYRIRVNSISPGAIRTPINTAAWSTPAAYDALMTLVPYDRIGEPEDIARAAVWLASDEADYVTGATLFIDGGMTLYPGFEAGG